MRIVKLALLALLVATLSSSLSHAVIPDRIAGAVSSGPSVTLPGNVHHKALPEFDRGPADPALRFGSIMLLTSPTRAQQKALTRLLAQQQDRRSPNYHRWLTPEQWADRFGLSWNDVQKITGWLKEQGFSNIHVARGRNWFMFSGTAVHVENTFGTEIHRFSVDGEMHVANATSPKIPAALAGIVTGIRGLDDFHLRPRGIRGVRPDYFSSTFGDLAAPGDIATIYGINALYTGGTDGTGQKLAVIGQTDVYLADLQDFRSGFGLSSFTCTANSSNVITACSDPHFSYVVAAGLTDPQKPLTTGDLSEADLDLEWSGAVARGAQIVYVNAPATFSGGSLISGGVWVGWYDAVDNNRAPVISLSYGLCEFYDNAITDPNTGLPAADEVELQKANSEGITFVNSSGDSGAAECDFGPPGTLTSTNLATQGFAVGYPASSPEVTGVGGTAVPLANFSSTYWGTSNGTNGGSALSYIPEQAWNDDLEIAEFCQQNPSNLFCTQGGNPARPGWVPITSEATAQRDLAIISTGGGASNCAKQNSNFTACVSGFPQPAWQTVTISGQTSARFSPDVSFLASPNFPGYIFCTQQSELPGDTGTGSACAPGGTTGITNALALNTPPLIGGTSASAPVFAGIVTLLNQYLAGSSAAGLGNVNPTLYSLAATPANGAFHPVTTGDNFVYCQVGSPGAPQPSTLWCPSSGVLGFSATAADTTTGYNLVTGLGSVDTNNLAVAWAATLSGFSMSASAPNPASVSAGTSAVTTVTVTPDNGFTGTVSLTCSSSPAGATCPAGGSVSGGSGSAQVTIQTAPNMQTGTVTVTITGTSGSISSTTTVTLTVTATNQSFTLAPQNATYQVTQGQSVTATITLTPNNGFNTALTYTCSEASTLTESTCTGPSGATTATSVSFQVTTTAPTFATRRPFDRDTRIFYATLLPGLLGIMLTFGSRRRPHGMRMLGLIMVLGFSTLWLGSCGGNNSTSHNPGTPKGAYTITINATTGGASPVTGSTTFTLQVQ